MLACKVWFGRAGVPGVRMPLQKPTVFRGSCQWGIDKRRESTRMARLNLTKIQSKGPADAFQYRPVAALVQGDEEGQWTPNDQE